MENTTMNVEELSLNLKESKIGGDGGNFMQVPEISVRPVSPVATRRWDIPKPDLAFIIAVSSRVLFNMSEERKIFNEQGVAAYIQHMIEHENIPLKPGSAFAFVQALHHVNLKLLEINPHEKNLFDVVLMSNNSAQIGVALINSINHHNLTCRLVIRDELTTMRHVAELTVERVCLTSGESVLGYLAAYGTDLYLSADEHNVVDALDMGIAAATMFPGTDDDERRKKRDQLRIAFDGDAVLFSDESEVIAKQHGLEKFFQHEANKADVPLEVGPLKRFAMLLGEVKRKFSEAGIIEDCPIRTYLVTARSAASSGLRALRTLRLWGLDIDEALFLAGAPKGPLLKKIQPHLFFDDQQRNVDSGLKHGVASAHVPYGIAQKLATERRSSASCGFISAVPNLKG